MKHDFSKRGYLLPKGCKDLADVLKLKDRQPEESSIRTIELPPIIGEITLPRAMTVRELARCLNRRPSRIIADLLMLFGDSCDSLSVRHIIQFYEIEQVVRLYGFKAKELD
jgi:hypothetical protein